MYIYVCVCLCLRVFSVRHVCVCVAQHTAQHSTPSTAQHSTAQHSTAQHSTAQHSTAQHTKQHSTAQHSTAQARAHSQFTPSRTHSHTHTHTQKNHTHLSKYFTRPLSSERYTYSGWGSCVCEGVCVSVCAYMGGVSECECTCLSV